MEIYHKIPGPFKRETEGPNKNKIIRGRWSEVHLETLQDVPWNWSEKIGGTNIRVEWDGHSVQIGGRTDNAQLHVDLVKRIQELFPEELLEQTFGEKRVMLFGEGYGAGIQRGGDYGPTKEFVLFDVKVGDMWLTAFNVSEVASSLGLTSVYRGGPPAVITLNEALALVEMGFPSYFKGGYAEGLVGTPVGGMLTRKGERIIVKVKHCDFYEGD